MSCALTKRGAEATNKDPFRALRLRKARDELVAGKAVVELDGRSQYTKCGRAISAAYVKVLFTSGEKEVPTSRN